MPNTTASRRIDGAHDKGATAMAELILIVEDDPGVIRVARAHLEREGFTVETAQDGLAGLYAALERPPTLIVLDWIAASGRPRIFGTAP